MHSVYNLPMGSVPTDSCVPKPPSARDKQGPRWKRRKDARPQEVIDAALELFGDFGYAQTRLEDVASRAGISKGTVYLYFSSKQDLFEAVIHERALPWLQQIASQTPNESDSTEVVLRRFLHWGWQQFLASRLHLIARVVLAESNNFPHLAKIYLREVMGPVHEHVGQLLQRGVARGEVHGEVTPERVKVLMTPLSWLSLWRQALTAHSEPRLDEERFLREAIDMVVGSVLVAPPAAREHVS
jgi:AcrR family transcriptional regulator